MGEWRNCEEEWGVYIVGGGGGVEKEYIEERENRDFNLAVDS